MAIEYQNNTAILSGFIEVEEAESLLQWVQSHSEGELDLSACIHINAACLQVLMAAKPRYSAWPADESLASWLRHILSS